MRLSCVEVPFTKGEEVRRAEADEDELPHGGHGTARTRKNLLRRGSSGAFRLGPVSLPLPQGDCRGLDESQQAR